MPGYSTSNQAHSVKSQVCLCQKGENAIKLWADIFQNSQELFAYRAGCMPQTKAGAVTYKSTIKIEWIAIECSK